MASAAASATRTHQVTLSSADTEQSYVLRGLEEREIPDWSSFCASVFAYKESPPPPSYFERHYSNDPDRQASFIRVAVNAEDKEIVASCRIFVRKVSTKNGTFLKAGGIGEVCTSPHHRKRGISKELLQDCIQIMTAEGFEVSFLHSAPAFFPVYQSAGYECQRTRWTRLPIHCDRESKTMSDSGSCKVRPAVFPNDTLQLLQLHQSFSENNFHGCIVRSKEYWEQYIAKEQVEGSLIVAELDDEDNGATTVVGWMALRERGGALQLREFGLADDKTDTTAASLFGMLLQRATEAIHAKSEELAMPTLVYERILQTWGPETLDCLKIEEASSDDDLGWMYKSLDGRPLPDFDSHLVWPSDSF